MEERKEKREKGIKIKTTVQDSKEGKWEREGEMRWRSKGEGLWGKVNSEQEEIERVTESDGSGNNCLVWDDLDVFVFFNLTEMSKVNRWMLDTLLVKKFYLGINVSLQIAALQEGHEP